MVRVKGWEVGDEPCRLGVQISTSSQEKGVGSRADLILP